MADCPARHRNGRRSSRPSWRSSRPVLAPVASTANASHYNRGCAGDGGGPRNRPAHEQTAQPIKSRAATTLLTQAMLAEVSDTRDETMAFDAARRGQRPRYESKPGGLVSKRDSEQPAGDLFCNLRPVGDDDSSGDEGRLAAFGGNRVEPRDRFRSAVGAQRALSNSLRVER